MKPSAERLNLLHPTDYGPDGRLALAHAVRLAERGHYALSLLNVATEELSPHHSGVRAAIDLLVRWNRLPANANAQALERDLGMDVVAVSIPAADARAGVLDYVDNHACDLVVLATRQHRGLSRWLERSLPHQTLRMAKSLALLLRENTHGFVDAKTGAMKLEKVLVPAPGGIDLAPG